MLGVARQAFLERGIRASTAKIAKRAGVSEGTLFHRYGSKAKLFVAAMAPPDWRPMLESLDLEGRVGQSTVEDNLAAIADALIGFFRQLLPWTMMSYSSRNEVGLHPGLRGKNPPPVILLKALGRYLEAEARRGRIRAVDSEVVARAIVGGAMQLVFGEVLAAAGAPLPITKDVFVRGLADLLMRGIAPSRRRRS